MFGRFKGVVLRRGGGKIEIPPPKRVFGSFLRSRWRLCRLTLDSRLRLCLITDVASPLRGDAAYSLRVLHKPAYGPYGPPVRLFRSAS